NEGSMIVTTKVTHGMLIKVSNYNVYQDPKNYEGNDENDTKGTTKEQRREREGNNNNKNVKNDKNDNKKPSSRKRVYDEESIHFKLAERLYNNILKNNPKHKKPNLQKWADDVRLMLERDGRTEEQIKYLMDWVQQDSFEMANVLSTR